MSRLVDVREESSNEVVYKFDDSDDVVEVTDNYVFITSTDDNTDRRELVSIEDVENFIKAVMIAANIKEVKL